jgi:hypothetical protein
MLIYQVIEVLSNLSHVKPNEFVSHYKLNIIKLFYTNKSIFK